MEALALLREAKAAGLSAQVVDGQLVVRGPKSAAPLVELLRQHKPAILVLLRYRQKYPGGGPGDAELREIADHVLSEGYVLLWSTVLQDFIAFYHDESDKARIPPGFVPYSDAELRLLFGEGEAAPSPNGLRLIHEAKKLGGGYVKSKEG